MFNRILVTGASGFIGSEISARLVDTTPNLFAGCFHNDPDFGTKLRFDIRDVNSINNAISVARPELIIHCAYDKTPELRDQVIVNGTKNLVVSCKELIPSVRFVFISSEWVFDGTAGPYSETDQPNPKTGYGKAKLAAEQIVSDTLANTAILRTGLVGRQEPPAPRWRIEEKKWQAGQKVVFYDNEIRNPIHVDGLARGIIMLSFSDEQGIWHLAGPEYMSRYDELVLYARYKGVSLDLVGASKSDGINRPLDCSIKNDKFLKRFNLDLLAPKDYYV